MDIVRTPEDRFRRLPNYPFKPNYLEVGSGLRMHYVDEGDTSSTHTVLMLHGEPTWSYLYRFMIPICAAAGHRVIAPDLVGFGKSDKPADIDDYSYGGHFEWLRAFVLELDLRNIVLVCQDWGSLLGLRLAVALDDRFSGIVLSNGFLPTGQQSIPLAFKAWRTFARFSPWFPISRIVEAGTFKKLSAGERLAYDAPFPSGRYKAGTRAFPRLVPTEPDLPDAQENARVWSQLEQWHKPFITAFTNGDPIMRGGDRYFQERVPGCQNMPHRTLTGGHFVQEDSPFEFAQTANELIRLL
ncbi:haloalkane dehalogenase [Allohahella marinimesophila]|uniref:Haloalkane dehalogenase n=1 Tax=Allohahella marinimesophila TaxID=1054972 RepID=A0ABP7PDE3_9GAMM